MNDTRRIALEFAMRINPDDAETVLECACKFEAYLSYAEQTDTVSKPAHDMAIRAFSDTEARP